MNRFLLAFLLLPVLSQAQTDTIPKVTDTLSRAKNGCGMAVGVTIYTLPSASDITTNLTNILNAFYTGLYATSSSAPGQSAAIYIRGFSDFYQAETHNIILDGAPYFGPLSAINKYDVGSIVLEKTPANLNLPMALSSGGALVITSKSKTKYGPKAKWDLSINTNVGMNTKGIPDYDIIRDPKTYYEMSWQALRNYNYAFSDKQTAGMLASERLVPYLNGSNLYDVDNNNLVDPVSGKLNPEANLRYQDKWPEAIERIGLRQQHHFSAAQAGDNGYFRLGAGYLQDDGYIRNSGFERFNVSVNGLQRFNKRLSLGITTSYSRTNDRYVGTDGGASPTISAYNPFLTMTQMPPVYTIYERDNDGQIIYNAATGDQQYKPIVGNRYNPVAWLLKEQRTMVTDNLFLAPYAQYTFPMGLTVSMRAATNQILQNQLETNQWMNYESRTDYSSLVLHPSISYKASVNDHSFETSVFYYNEQRKSKYTEWITDATIVSTYSEISQRKSSIAGWNLLYNYKKRLTVTGRLNKHLVKSYVVTTPENSWDWLTGFNLMLIDKSKISLQLFSNYSDASQYDLSLPRLQAFAIPEYKGPSFQQLEAGAKLNLHDTRFTLTYFNKKTSDAIYSLPTGPGRGVYGNDAAILNSGLEASVTTVLLNKKEWFWYFYINATLLNNKTLALTNNRDSGGVDYSLLTAGQPISNFYLAHYGGVDPLTGNAYYLNRNGGTTTNTTDLTFSDYYYGGSRLPKVFGSIGNNLRYKQLNLSFSFAYSLGGKVYDQVYANLMGGNTPGGIHKDALKSWTPENTTSDIPQLNTRDYNIATSTRFLVDASWLNLKYVMLSYNLPHKLFKKAGFKDISLYVAGENIFLLSSRKGLDPNASLSRISGYSYAPMRTTMVGARIDL